MKAEYKIDGRGLEQGNRKNKKKTQVLKENDEQLCISYRRYYSLELFQCAKGLFYLSWDCIEW